MLPSVDDKITPAALLTFPQTCAACRQKVVLVTAIKVQNWRFSVQVVWFPDPSLIAVWAAIQVESENRTNMQSRAQACVATPRSARELG